MKRILITRPRAQADDFAQKLGVAGFEAIFFPVIDIQAIKENHPLDRAFKQLNCYEWVVFTSVNAVKVVFDKFSQVLTAKGGKLRFAAIGPKTAEALKQRGVTPDFVPQEYVAEAILPGLGDLKNRWVLLPRAEIARKALPDAIIQAGGIAHEIPVYKTLPAQPSLEAVASLKAGVDWITFTSPSTVQNFVEIIRRQRMDPFQLSGDPKIACIGPITDRAAQEEGFRVDVVAEQYTTEGLVRALLKAQSQEV
jgi:uroporphyrinogen III methyltransferase / synthase